MIDPITAYRSFLQGQASLTVLLVADADKGIYRTPPGLPASLADANTAPKCVVLQAVGGESNPAWPDLITRVYLRCYAPSGPAAMEIYRRVWDLHYRQDGRARGPLMINDRWLMRSADVAQPLSTLEDASQWPMVAASIQIRMDALIGDTTPP